VRLAAGYSCQCCRRREEQRLSALTVAVTAFRRNYNSSNSRRPESLSELYRTVLHCSDHILSQQERILPSVLRGTLCGIAGSGSSKS
jgi:hypothetical protein